ncbi:unnamed protein product [Angiostrongylus costaricensis]|uniref:Secreted protein n=1 Tax=Angiostrongylus costaricensis TaxID=334426 RepID=A0A0R3PZW2_ANGCS|nr:unnamed protein product [Angiostrongylus costaricensis]
MDIHACKILVKALILALELESRLGVLAMTAVHHATVWMERRGQEATVKSRTSVAETRKQRFAEEDAARRSIDLCTRRSRAPHRNRVRGTWASRSH